MSWIDHKMRGARRLLHAKHPAPGAKFRLICLALAGRRHVSYGFNSIKTHTRSQRVIESHHIVSRYAKGESPYLCPHIHAEWAALNKARGVVDTVVIYRERKDGSAAMARPCNVCMALLKARGVRLVIYTGKDGLPLMEKI